MEQELREFVGLFLEIRSKTDKKFGGKFDFKKFKSMDSIQVMQHYADTFLEKLGEGSSRVAYVFSNRYALKIARNEKGLSQNEAEIDIFTNPKTRDAVAKIHDYDTNNMWLIADIVRPLKSEEEFENFTGVEMATFKLALKMVKQNKSIDALPAQLRQKKFIVAAVQNTLMHNMGIGDIAKFDHWGKTPDGRLVLLDYGFTEEVWGKHYSDKSTPAKQAPVDDRDAPTNAGGKQQSHSQERSKRTSDDRDAPTNAGGKPAQNQKRPIQKNDDRDEPTRVDRKAG